MKSNSITEGNKIIARFMKENPVTDYHKNWSSLMPVLHGINTLVKGYEFESLENQTFEEKFDMESTLEDFMNNDITHIWEKAVDWIEFYQGEESYMDGDTKVDFYLDLVEDFKSWLDHSTGLGSSSKKSLNELVDDYFDEVNPDRERFNAKKTLKD